MLTEICAYLRNYFDRDSVGQRLPSWSEEITINGRELVGFADRLLPGQCYRIMDSALNDGVYRYGIDKLTNETFVGTVQAMKIPPDVLLIDKELTEWVASHTDALNSPYQSESFGGYTYSLKADAGDAAGGGFSWKTQFASRLAPWRKI